MSIIPPNQTSGSYDQANSEINSENVASVDVSDILAESQVMEVLDKLDQELVGLKSVKTRIREVAALLLIDRMRQIGRASCRERV